MHLSELDNRYDLAARLGVSLDQLEALLVDHERLYVKHQFRKKRPGSGYRTVYEAEEFLRDRHRAIALWIQDSWVPLDCVHGFRKKRSMVTNAKRHVGQESVAVADIKDFFESISKGQVALTFERLGAKASIAEDLSTLCTINGFLPAGTRCSPIIANAFLEPVDIKFSSLPCAYTRYADDIAFSGNTTDLPLEVEIRDILHSVSGLRLREKSFRVRTHPATQWVTGLVVNHQHGPHYIRSIKKHVRQEAYYIEQFGLAEHCRRTGQDPTHCADRLLGQLRHMLSVEPSVARPLLTAVKRKIREWGDEQAS